jgi:glutamyl-tRNA synthetase
MYRGRLAPSPTGYLHLGHARTFWTAQQRADAVCGTLVLRNEDMDAQRFCLDFVSAMLEDLCWFGFRWQEGPDCGGPFVPYAQSERGHFYRAALEELRHAGWIYPCRCSRSDVLRALQAPHAGEEEPVYPGTCRPASGTDLARVLVQARAKPRKGFEFLELGVSELEVARRRAVSGDLLFSRTPSTVNGALT